MNHPKKRLDAVAEILMGQAPPGESYNLEGDGWPLLAGAGDFKGEHPVAKDRSALKCIDPEIESAYARSRIKGNELLLSCVGSIGTVAEVGPADIGSNIARAVARIPVSETVNRKWLAACLRSSHIQRYFTNELRTVSQPTLNIKQIKETEINLPPIELQNTFASKLHAVERVCKRSSFSEAQTRQMISAIQSRAFSGLLQLQ
jgi:type I restriction enzyme S subunit